MSADIKREGASYMNKKLNLLVMLVSLLALSLVIGSCDNGTTSGGGGKSTTLKVVNNYSQAIARIRVYSDPYAAYGGMATHTYLEETHNDLVPAGQTKTFSSEDEGTANIAVSVGIVSDDGNSFSTTLSDTSKITFELGKTTTATLGADGNLTVGSPE
jgi:hypothetical protein